MTRDVIIWAKLSKPMIFAFCARSFTIFWMTGRLEYSPLNARLV